MRHRPGSDDNLRSSALWGKGPKGSRSRVTAALVAAAIAFTAPVAAAQAKAFMPKTFAGTVAANPNKAFNVIVQGSGGSSAAVAQNVSKAMAAVPGKAKGLERKFSSIPGVAAQLTGKQIAKLAAQSDVYSVTPDAPVILQGYSSSQLWPSVAGLQSFWTTMSPGSAPTIAIVDSGIDTSKSDFSGRILGNVNLSSLTPNSPGDGYGHGTLVAGIAAGAGSGYAGGAPRARILSLDVMDDSGKAMTSDVIAAADWLLRNKSAYNIRVANFSLSGTVNSSFMYDPLDKAVEKLWLGGIVVVAAAGNYGTGATPSGVLYAPGNDPFVITVGASDTNGTLSTLDDVAAPWSSYGYTLDGFAKPELGAPGRYMVGPVPAGAALPAQAPDRVVAPGYMWMSGTSFAAPVVAAAAADVVAVHPGWTPDQIKGALMLTAQRTAAPGYGLGVGEVNGAAAAAVLLAPNPNAAIDQFVGPDPNGGSVPVFDAASWASAARASASWASASWADASWASASWASASWASASWASASWASASWASASWADASWASASWASASWVS